jgi:serine/threonine-protein kinase
VPDDTLIQFAGAPPAETIVDLSGSRPRATVCKTCGQHFSADGRFCPFDGEPLSPAESWDPRADPLLGSLVDNRYEIEAVIGEGGMGTVYAVRHRSLGKRFALKALRKDLANDREVAARFMQEARTAAVVSHPALVEITDFGRLPSGPPYFVMELLEGRSLADLIRAGGPIPAARAVDIIRQIADGMTVAHEANIVHRDLKPENIHIGAGEGGRDRVKVVDFGLAKVIGASRLTRAGVVFGTPHYMSPEQALGEPVDHRSDIYALGIVMYEMFTGRVPFEADSYMGVLTKHMYMAPVPPSQLIGTAKLGALEDVTLRCLEKKPQQRYESLRALVADLDRALSTSGVLSEAGSLRKERASARSLLADELELPTREELTLGLSRANAFRARWPLAAIGVLFLSGIGSAMLLRRTVSAPSVAATHAPAASPPAQATQPVPVAASVTPNKPMPTLPIAVTPPPSVSTSVRTVPESHARVAPPRVPPSKPTDAAKGSVVRPAMGGEIVDPWAH